MANELISVEVAYAMPELQIVASLALSAGSTAEQAIQASGILQQFPEINLSRQKIGIFGTVCNLDKIIIAGDRVEIYRPLLQDPMMARRNRVQKCR